MSNSFGKNYRFTIFGSSHGPCVGVTIEGLPSGTPIDIHYINSFLSRRAPGQSKYSTSRKEPDEVVFTSGVDAGGRSCSPVITAVIYNRDVRSADYSELEYKPRPGHADYPAMMKYGAGYEFAGGGQFSGRMTAPLCIAGAIALHELEDMGISISSRIVSINGCNDEKSMFAAIERAQQAGDSVGGVVECIAEGVPVGVGEPMFAGLENHISAAVFGIPAVKGIEFGAGFAAAEMLGNENNDEYYFDGDSVRTYSNNAGGILGGLSNGQNIVFRAAVKPTPSIACRQRTVDMKNCCDTLISVGGRHDACIVPRVLPCMEAAMAVAIYDLILENRKCEELESLRRDIDDTDARLLELFRRRMELSREIGLYKAEHELPVFDGAREEEKLAKIAALSGAGLSEYSQRLWRELMQLSKDYQRSLSKEGE